MLIEEKIAGSQVSDIDGIRDHNQMDKYFSFTATSIP